MHKIKEKLKEQLYEYEERIKKNPATRLTSSDVQVIHTLTDTVKNICKIDMYEDYDDGESKEGRMHYEGESSYRRGRMNAKRDSMGRYSRESGYSERGIGEYSYGSSKDEMLEKIEEMKREIERM